MGPVTKKRMLSAINRIPLGPTSVNYLLKILIPGSSLASFSAYSYFWLSSPFFFFGVSKITALFLDSKLTHKNSRDSWLSATKVSLETCLVAFGQPQQQPQQPHQPASRSANQPPWTTVKSWQLFK